MDQSVNQLDSVSGLVLTPAQGTPPAPIMTIRNSITNVASVPQRSLFRYPGGKTWLVPEVRAWLGAAKPRLLIEPFCGGGIISLTAVAEGLVERAILTELDPQVSAVWRTALNESAWLIRRITSFEVTKKSVARLLGQTPRSTRELGFQTIVRNRVQRGGILANGAGLIKDGENGKGLRSRWYPETLASRIEAIQQYRDRLWFIQGNAFDVIDDHVNNPDAAFFVDPPYTAGGKRAGQRLYTHNVVDHRKLFALMSGAAGPVMMTYDEAEEVKILSTEFRMAMHKIPMKNTHHTRLNELIITKPATMNGHRHVSLDEMSERRLAADVQASL